jgi:rod shape-determining protein MreD
MKEVPVGFHDARKNRVSKFNWMSILGVPLAAILFQVVVPRFIPDLSYLELPLLVTIYFSLVRRSPVAGVLFGAGIGLAQDSLAPPLPLHPLGMFGIAKTLVGYSVGSVSQRFEVGNPTVRLVLTLFFFFFHQFFYWFLQRALLSEPVDFEFLQTIVLAGLNAAVAVPLFHVLDKLKVTD